jgi:hypothetical protein
MLKPPRRAADASFISSLRIEMLLRIAANVVRRLRPVLVSGSAKSANSLHPDLTDCAPHEGAFAKNLTK